MTNCFWYPVHLFCMANVCRWLMIVWLGCFLSTCDDLFIWLCFCVGILWIEWELFVLNRSWNCALAEIYLRSHRSIVRLEGLGVAQIEFGFHKFLKIGTYDMINIVRSQNFNRSQFDWDFCPETFAFQRRPAI